jgi:Tfp pilus assembly protein PilO
MTSKTKNILLLSGFFLTLIVCYRFAISNTLELKKQYKNLKQQEVFFNNTPKQLSLLKQKHRYYDSILSKYQLNGSSVQNSLLKTINEFATNNNLKVITFIEPHVIKQNDLTIKTYEFTVEGNFNAIIKLTHKLEQQTKLGEIINLHFEKKKNFRTGKYYLQTKILLKSFG